MNNLSTFLFVMLFLFISCKPKDGAPEQVEVPTPQPSVSSSMRCEDIPAVFTTEDEAKAAIQNSTFRVTDQLGEGKSPWINNAHYYSCNNESGFMIVLTDREKLLHAGLPGTVWEEFKNAESPGAYYNNFIRDRFLVTLK